MTSSSDRATSCPSDDDLVRLVEGALADVSLASIEQHLDGCERCAAVVAELGALRPTATRVVGRYQLDRRIAAGGMGEVWAAWDPTLRRDIAIKLVRPDRADDGRERERLLREARALARLQHPNVLAVYDVGLADGDVFLATELVAGDTLASRGGATADWRALARLYAQAARGLAAAHAAGLVHRDVKPANLLLGADGRVRVADFGLAVRTATPSAGIADVASLDPQITASGHIAGTPAYMAPEQRLGSPADARADQFALCVALVESIDGRRPTADLGADALIAFVGTRRVLEPALEALCRVLARGLAGPSDERHPDMTALADAIERTTAVADGEIVVDALARAAPAEIGAIKIAPSPTPATLLGTPAPATDRRAGSERTGDSEGTRVSRSSAPATDTAPRSRIKPLVVVAGAVLLGLGAFGAWKITRTPSSATGNVVAEATPTGDSASNTTSPNATPPNATAPDATAPDATAPNATAPNATAPNATAPNATTPNATAPNAITPNATSPNAITPSTTPNRTAPSTTAPSVAPGKTVPQVGTSPGGARPPPAHPAPIAVTPPVPPPTGTPPAPAPASNVSVSDALDELGLAIRHRDPRRCRDIVDALDPTALDPTQTNTFEMLHARCEMIGGDCAGGARRAEALYKRATVASAVVMAVQVESDSFCPVTGDLATIKRRLLAQTTHMMVDPAACRLYVAPARQLASAAGSDMDKRVAGSVIAAIAKCFSSAGQCDQAHALLREADSLVPGLDNPGELTSACK